MQIKPYNRYLLIEPELSEAPKDDSSILVPEEYKPRSAHTTVKVVAIAEDCKALSSLKVGDRILCNNSMVEEVKIDGETYYLLLENYVLCLVS